MLIEVLLAAVAELLALAKVGFFGQRTITLCRKQNYIAGLPTFSCTDLKHVESGEARDSLNSNYD